MRLGQICVSLLLILGSANVFAEPGQNRHGGRDPVRAFQVQNVTLDRDQRGAPPAAQQAERSRGRLLGLPGSGDSGQNDNPSNSSADNERRQGRLSPEERRALRRQIDEVGHDIYSPKR